METLSRAALQKKFKALGLVGANQKNGELIKAIEEEETKRRGIRGITPEKAIEQNNTDIQDVNVEKSVIVGEMCTDRSTEKRVDGKKSLMEKTDTVIEHIEEIALAAEPSFYLPVDIKSRPTSTRITPSPSIEMNAGVVAHDQLVTLSKSSLESLIASLVALELEKRIPEMKQEIVKEMMAEKKSAHVPLRTNVIGAKVGKVPTTGKVSSDTVENGKKSSIAKVADIKTTAVKSTDSKLLKSFESRPSSAIGKGIETSKQPPLTIHRPKSGESVKRLLNAQPFKPILHSRLPISQKE